MAYVVVILEKFSNSICRNKNKNRIHIKSFENFKKRTRPGFLVFDFFTRLYL
jgi:hypothetical protein